MVLHYATSVNPSPPKIALTLCFMVVITQLSYNLFQNSTHIVVNQLIRHQSQPQIWRQENGKDHVVNVKVYLRCGITGNCYIQTARVPVFLAKFQLNPLKAELNPMCCLLALLGAHHFLHVSRIRVKSLTLRQVMLYIYGAPILDVCRSHTTTHHSR